MAANNIYIQVDFNSAGAQQNVNALNQAIAQTGPAASKSSQQATSALQSVSVQVQQTGRAFSELTTALAGLGLTRLVSNWIQVSSELERSRLAMTAFTGSVDEANKVFEQVRAIAAQSPFRFKELEESARMLLGFGVAAKEVPTYLRAITDQVARMGGSIDSVNNIIRVFGRMVEKDFVGAMDLIRSLPQQGIPVMEALRQQLSRQLKIDISVPDVRDAMKQGLLDPMSTLQTMISTMQRTSGGFGQSLNDPLTAFKNLGDMIVYAKERLMGPEGFGPAVANLAREIQTLLAPIGGLIDELLRLPEGTKEAIVNVVALTAAVVALAGAFTLFKGILGPVLGLLTALVEIGPAVLAVTGALAGLGYVLYQTVPQVKGWVDEITGSIKGKLTTLAKEGQDLLAGIFKPQPIEPGAILNVEAQRALFEKISAEQEKVAATAQKTLLEALASPVEAVRIKYADLFNALEEKIKLLAPEMQNALRGILSGAETAELQTALLRKQKEYIDERAKYETERVKGSYDAQIAYIEAADAQDLRTKVANIDRVTELRMQSAHEVSLVEQDALQQTFQNQARLIEAHRADLAKAGLDADQMIARLREETAAKQGIIDQKAFDDAQKYRLEGWKKANDAIIEDQKRVYQQFTDIFDQIFNAFTSKTKSIGQALSDVFKSLALGEVRQFFSSQAAAFATEAAGYGRPEEALPQRGAGLLGTLFRRGTPPRPPLPPPEAYLAGTTLSGLVPAGKEVGDAFTQLVPPTITAGTALQNLAIAAQYATAAMSQRVSGLPYAPPGAPGAPSVPTGGALPPLPFAPGAGEMLPRPATFGSQFLRYVQGGQGGAALSTLPGSILTGAAGALVPPSGNPPTTAAQMPLSELGGLAIQTAAGALSPSPMQSSLLADIRRRESGNRYRAQNPHTSASGAYQIIDETWRRLTRETGIGTQYSHAKDAPPWIQDINALQLLRTKGPNDPGSWGGQPYGAFPELAQAQLEQAMVSSALTAPMQPAAAPPVAEPVVAGPAVPAGVSAGALTLAAIPTPPAIAPSGGFNWRSLLGGFGGGGQGGGAGSAVGWLGQLRQLFTTPAMAAAVQTAVFGETPGAESLSRAATTTGGGVSLTSILGSQGAAQLMGLGGGLLSAAGLQRRVAPLTVLGGALAGPGLARTLGLSPEDTPFAAAGPLGGLAQGLALGAGVGIFTAGLQRGGGLGLLGTTAGGALAGFSIAGPIGAAIGAAVGAIAGTIRLFVKTEQERIRQQIKQTYGIDISNRQILQQIQQIVDQKYGGSVSVGIRSQDVQDIVRLYALSTGQAAMLPRPMYAATIAEQGGQLQLQPVYQGGQLVQNPYTGATTYQYQTAVTQALGLRAGTSQGVPGASGLISNMWVSLNAQQANNLLTGQVVNIMQSNPSAVASANASAARAGDSRLTTSAAMTSPLTALP